MALPGPTAIKKTRYLGKTKIATQSTVFQVHRTILEYPGIGTLVKAKREETWIFCLQAEEYPTVWDIRVTPDADPIFFRLSQVRLEGTLRRFLRIKAQTQEVQVVLPLECTLEPFSGGHIDPVLFDSQFGDLELIGGC